MFAPRGRRWCGCTLDAAGRARVVGDHAETVRTAIGAILSGADALGVICNDGERAEGVRYPGRDGRFLSCACCAGIVCDDDE